MGDLCINCGERPATVNWVSADPTLAFVHGMTTRWCECCALEAQLEHAREMAAKIPELEVALAKLAKEPEPAFQVGGTA